MKNKIFIFFLLFFAYIKIIQAQDWNQRKYEFIYGIGVVNFMGDVAAPAEPSKVAWMHLFKTISPIADVGLRYNIEKRHYANASLSLGQLFAEDPLGNPKYNYRGLRFNSFFTEVALKYEFLIFKEKNRSTVYKQLGESRLKNFNLPTYLFIGAGANLNFGKLISRSGSNVYFDSFFNVAPVIPFGIGVKTRLTRYTYLNIEAGARITFSDGMDNAKGKDDIRFGDYVDQYQFLTINLIHKLKSNKSGLPIFRN